MDHACLNRIKFSQILLQPTQNSESGAASRLSQNTKHKPNEKCGSHFHSIRLIFFRFSGSPLHRYLNYVELAFGESSSGFVSFKISSWNLLWDKEASVRRRSFTSCRRNHGKNSGFSLFREKQLFDKKKSSWDGQYNTMQSMYNVFSIARKKGKHPLWDVH